MQRVLITFLDGEVMHAETPSLAMAHPVLEVEVSGADPNIDRALLPLSSLRLILVGDMVAAPPVPELERWDRAVFRFADGEVMRGRIAPKVHLGVFGGVWDVVAPGGDEQRTLAIPYTALKGVFAVRSWDSRSSVERAARAAGEPPHLDQMVRALAERDARGMGGGRDAARRGALSERMAMHEADHPEHGIAAEEQQGSDHDEYTASS